VTAIWNQIVFLFEAWVTPLHDGQLQEAATWIQQLAGNQKLLMPWAPSDVKIASVMTTMMMKCAEFLHFVVPGNIPSPRCFFSMYLKEKLFFHLSKEIFNISHLGILLSPLCTSRGARLRSYYHPRSHAKQCPMDLVQSN